MPKKSKHPVRKRLLEKRHKGTNKDAYYEERKVAEWKARLKAKQQCSGDPSPGPRTAQTTRTNATTEDDPESDEEPELSITEAEKRVVIKVMYLEAGSPPEEDWGERDGTIAHIRHRMGTLAPCIPMVRNTLIRLAGGDTDIAASKRGGTGRPRKMSRLDDMLVALLAVEGQSQRTYRAGPEGVSMKRRTTRIFSPSRPSTPNSSS